MSQGFKCLMLGDASVGKSALINQFVNRRFAYDYKSTIGTDFFSRAVSVGDEIVQLSIFDSAGQERFRSLCASFYRGSDVCVVVFDITSAESFEHVPEWIDEFRRVCNIEPGERFPFLICGNKNDLENERAVPQADASRWATDRGYLYFETSAKMADGVDYMFREAASAAHQRKQQRVHLDEVGLPGRVQRPRLAPVQPTTAQAEEGTFARCGCGNG